jgi:radical SAM protein with 4Fe4S-binding SPASM domain
MLLMKHLSRWQAATSDCPISVVAIETTQHCNRRCHYCPVSFDAKPVRAMEPGVFREIIGQLASIRFHGRLTYHFYNEPLLNADLEKLVAYAARYLSGVDHVIYSNGDLLTTERAESLFAAGVTKFVVTDHGGKELTEPVLRAKRRPRSLGSRIQFRRYTPDTALFNRGGLVKVENQRKLKYCAYPAYELIIDVDGNVILCCNDYYGSHQFGNVMEMPILDIWNSASMSQLRNRLLRGHFDLPICQVCAGIPVSGGNQPLKISRPH